MRKPQKLVINWRAIPFIRLTLPFVIGISLAEYLNIHHFLMNMLLYSLLFSLFYFRRKLTNYSGRWIPGMMGYAFFLVLGYLLTYNYQDIKQTDHFRYAINNDNYFIGVVNNMPKISNGKIKIKLNTQLIGSKKQELKECGGQILLYLNDAKNVLQVKYGDQLLVKSKILSLQETKNPHAFDYKKYLHFQNIHYQSFVNQDNWKVLKNNQGNLILQTAFQLRTHFIKVLKKNIPSEKEAAIASALILGYKDDLSIELKSAYAESGAIHVLAVSGLHVGIVSGLLLLFLNLFQFKNQYWKWLKLVLILLAIWSFALITGMSNSVQRAALMFSALHIGRAIDREINIYNSLAAAAFFVLIMNPYSLFDIGFQFSFLAVTGIVFFTKKITKFWIPKHWLFYRIWQMTVVGISAQMAVFPLSLYYFHQVPTYFWLTGIFVIPFASFILYGGIALLIFSFISETITGILGWITFAIIYFQNWLISLIQQLPLHFLNGIWITPLEIWLFYFAILGLGLMLLTRRLRYLQAVFFSLLLVSCVQLKKDYEQEKQKKIVVYSISKTSVIDFIDGKKIYSLTAENLTENTLAYTIQNNRWSLGVDKIIPVEGEEEGNINFYKNKNYLQFYSKKIVIVNQNTQVNKGMKKPFDCDYLILQNNPKANIRQLRKVYNFKEIIFDGSNSNWKIKDWKIECQKLDVKYKDVKNESAYTIEL